MTRLVARLAILLLPTRFRQAYGREVLSFRRAAADRTRLPGLAWRCAAVPRHRPGRRRDGPAAAPRAAARPAAHPQCEPARPRVPDPLPPTGGHHAAGSSSGSSPLRPSARRGLAGRPDAGARHRRRQPGRRAHRRPRPQAVRLPGPGPPCQRRRDVSAGQRPRSVSSRPSRRWRPPTSPRCGRWRTSSPSISATATSRAATCRNACSRHSSWATRSRRWA